MWYRLTAPPAHPPRPTTPITRVHPPLLAHQIEQSCQTDDFDQWQRALYSRRALSDPIMPASAMSFLPSTARLSRGLQVDCIPPVLRYFVRNTRCVLLSNDAIIAR